MRLHGPESEEVGTCWRSLGNVFDDSGDYGRALECYRKALAIYLKALGPEHT